MKQIRNIAVALSGAVMMSGCSFMSPVKLPPDVGYVINTTPQHVQRARQHHRTLMIMRPETNPVYNTVRLAFTDRPYQISYYSYSHWVEVPADMLMPLLAETMQDTHRFRAIITPPYTGQYDYALRTQIQMLSIDYTQRVPVMQFHLQAQLLRASTGNVISSREFKTSVPLSQRTPFSAVVAANHATSIVLKNLAAWCVKSAR